MSELKKVAATNAPAAIGPYSAGIVANGFVFCSGQLPIDPGTGELVAGSLHDMTVQSMNNIRAVLEAAGSSVDKIVKTTIYVRDLAGFAEINAAYGTFFQSTPPARACVEVSALPKGALVEIEAIAVL